MELLDGETLEARLARGPLGSDATLRIGAEPMWDLAPDGRFLIRSIGDEIAGNGELRAQMVVVEGVFEVLRQATGPGS